MLFAVDKLIENSHKVLESKYIIVDEVNVTTYDDVNYVHNNSPFFKQVIRSQEEQPMMTRLCYEWNMGISRVLPKDHLYALGEKSVKEHMVTQLHGQIISAVYGNYIERLSKIHHDMHGFPWSPMLLEVMGEITDIINEMRKGG